MVVGIDFGTHSTYAATPDGRLLPLGGASPAVLSTVTYGGPGGPAVGVPAEDALPGETAVVAPKRLLGRREASAPGTQVGDGGRLLVEVGGDGELLPPERVCAEVFRRVRDRAEPPFEAVVTVPAYYSDAQRKATMDAARIGGWTVLRVLNEPTAAALHCCPCEGEEAARTVLVFDLGAGTLDCTALTVDEGVYEVLATAGDCDLGSRDVDEAVASLFRADLGRASVDEAELRAVARAAKEALSEADPALTHYRGAPLRLSWERLRRVCADGVLRRCVGVARRCLADARERPSQVLFVGGGSALRGLRAHVCEALGLPEAPGDGYDPRTAVALGAARQAAALTGGAADAPLLLDVTPLTLGLDCSDGWMVPVLPRGSRLPASASETFTTWVDNQTAVDVQVCEGERERADQNLKLGEFALTGLPQAPAGELQIEVAFDVDTSGCLTVGAHELSSGKSRSVAIRAEQLRLPTAEVDRLLAEAERHAATDRAEREAAEAAQDYRRYLRRMAKVLTFDPRARDHPEAQPLLARITREAGWLEEGGVREPAEVDARHRETAAALDAMLGEAHADGEGVEEAPAGEDVIRQ